MKIVAFDLSTTCTGVAIAEVGLYVEELRTMHIAPVDVNPESLGFMKTKRKVVTPRGTSITSYVLTPHEIVTKKEKENRDLLYKTANEEWRTEVMARGIDEIIRVENPGLVLMEKNMAFRSMDVTRKLGEIAGILISSATVHEIPLFKVNVNHARERYNIPALLQSFVTRRTPQELKAMKDVTKEAIKAMLLAKYLGHGLNPNMTTDESDALLILDFYLATEMEIL